MRRGSDANAQSLSASLFDSCFCAPSHLVCNVTHHVGVGRTAHTRFECELTFEEVMQMV